MKERGKEAVVDFKPSAFLILLVKMEQNYLIGLGNNL
jgi:hypothetical protein